MARIDRYVARAAWGSYAGALIGLLLLAILMDQVLNVFDYVGAGRARGMGSLEILRVLAIYYASMVPVLFVTLSPFVSVVAGMFAVTRLMAANEIVPMVFTGRAVWRVLRPVLLMGLLSGLMTAACWQFVVPATSESLRVSRKLLSGRGGDTVIERIVLEFDEGGGRQTLFCSRYDWSRLRMEDVKILSRDAARSEVVVTSAAVAEWDPERRLWELERGLRRTFTQSDTEDGVRTMPSHDSPADDLALPGLTPDLLEETAIQGRETVELSYSELLALQEIRPDDPTYRLAFHTHITYPLANVVLLLLALPFAVHFERKSRVERVVLAVAVCAVYLITDVICQRLGQAYLHPVVAAWVPTIVFGSIGVAAFSGVRS